MSQGLEHSWLERITHVAMRVHHTKCMITFSHKHTHTHTMYNAITQSRKMKQTGGKQTFEAHEETNKYVIKKKRWCPRRTKVGLDRVSIVPLDWNMDDT